MALKINEKKRNSANNLLWQSVLESAAPRGEIGRKGCEISSLVEHMGLSPLLFL